MINKTLFIYNSPYLFKILNEIKITLNFEIQHIDKKEYEKMNFDQFKNYSIISTDNNNIKNCLILSNLPEKINRLVEKININFLKNQFINQSKLKVGKYSLDLNSRRIFLGTKSLSLTEKETNLIVYINSKNIVNLKNIQKKSVGLFIRSRDTYC